MPSTQKLLFSSLNWSFKKPSHLSLLFSGTLHSVGYIFPFLPCLLLIFFPHLFVVSSDNHLFSLKPVGMLSQTLWQGLWEICWNLPLKSFFISWLGSKNPIHTVNHSRTRNRLPSMCHTCLGAAQRRDWLLGLAVRCKWETPPGF